MQQAISGWTAEETKELFNLVGEKTNEGKGLGAAFKEFASRTGRKSGSVRNFYYAQAKTLSLVPEARKSLGIKCFTAPKKNDFVPFSKTEVDELVKYILIEQAKGRSVRNIIAERAHGDATIMLRLQNKYRSIIFSRRGYAKRIIGEMKAQGHTFYNPLTKEIVRDGKEGGNNSNLMESLESLSSALNESELKSFLIGLTRLLEAVGGSALGADEQSTNHTFSAANGQASPSHSEINAKGSSNHSSSPQSATQNEQRNRLKEKLRTLAR